MKELKIFENQEFGKIRVLQIENETWFVLNDICAGLEIENSRNVKNRLEKDDVRIMDIIDRMGRKQKATTINEFALYDCILMSRKPTAKGFKHWITHEVLPQIRKTGQYSIQKRDSYLIENPIERAKRWIEEQEEKLKLQAENEKMKPKALFADCVAVSENSILIRDFAKILRQSGVQTGEKRLYNWLRHNGYIIKNSCMPTQKSMEQGLFEVVERTVSRGDKPPLTKITTRITGKGQIFFINKLVNENLQLS